MKFLSALLLTISTLGMYAAADRLPDELEGNAPTVDDINEKLRPPEGHSVYEVFYGTGYRVYQCNPELTGFLHWYAVQTHVSLYRTEDHDAPYDLDGWEIGSISVAPLSGTQPDPIDTIPVLYYYPDGSWVGTSRPLVTTTKDEDRLVRGDAGNLDDHLVRVAYQSDSGYLSYTKYLARVGTLEGIAPPANECRTQGQVEIKPFTAFYMLYTDQVSLGQLAAEKAKWNQKVEGPAAPASF